MNCDRFVELFSLHLDGAASPEEEALLAAHPNECEECRDFAALMEGAHAELEIMAVEPPEALCGAVMEAVAAERAAGRVTVQKKKKSFGRYGALAAAVAVLILAAWAVPRTFDGNLPAAESAAEKAEEPALYAVTDSTADVQMTASAEAPEAEYVTGGSMDYADEVRAEDILTEEAEAELPAPEPAASMPAESTPANDAAFLPALPYSEDFSAVLIWYGTMPEELAQYPVEEGAETELYVFVPTEEARHMMENGAYTVFREGLNITPEAGTALVIVYGGLSDAQS